MEQMQRSYEERIDDEVPTHIRAFTEGEMKRDFETVTKSVEDYEKPKDHSSHRAVPSLPHMSPACSHTFKGTSRKIPRNWEERLLELLVPGRSLYSLTVQVPVVHV